MIRRLKDWFRRNELDRSIEEEMASHVEMRAELNRNAGMDPDTAQRAARLRFGNPVSARERTRSVHLGEWFESIAQDVHYAIRQYRRDPLFTVTAVMTVMLGVGASSAVFSVVDRILFRDLPYPNGERLVSVGFSAPIEPAEFLLGADYVEWKRAKLPFEQFTSWRGTVDCDLTEASPQRLSCGEVEWNFVPALGIRPFIGRSFTAEEDLPGGPGAVMLTYAFWHARFHGDPRVVGRGVSIDGVSRNIVGVLPKEFEMPTLNRVDVLVPQRLNPAGQRRPNTGAVLRGFARLRPGITPEMAQQQMQPLFSESLKFVPPAFRKEVKLVVHPLRARRTQEVRNASVMLFGAVLAVLLIACLNVANLLLARAASRRPEMAARAALGASRARLLRQNLTETLVLGVAGGMAGLGLAALLLRSLPGIAPEGLLHLANASLDWRVFAFALTCSIIAGVVSGLVPALEKPPTLAAAGRNRAAMRAPRFQHALISTQIALSLALLTGATLLLESLRNLEQQPLGFTRDHLSLVHIALNRHRYATPQQRLAFWESLEQTVATIPGVQSLAVSDSAPPAGRSRSMIYSIIDVEGRPPIADGTGGMVVWRSVTPGYFTTLGTRIVQGRPFEAVDRQPGSDVLIMDEQLAHRMFPQGDAVGKRVRPGRSGPWRTVVGVAGANSNAGLTGKSDPEYYLARPRSPDAGLFESYVLVRSAIGSESLSRSIRSAVALLDAQQPVEIESMDQRIANLADRPRFNAVLLTGFACAGLLLAAVGLYGVTGFLVSQRQREICIRMAVGASRSRMLLMVLERTWRWTAAGLLAGLAGAWWLNHALVSLLFGVKPGDPAVYLGASLTVLVLATLAALLPSLRAARSDPAMILRQE